MSEKIIADALGLRPLEEVIPKEDKEEKDFIQNLPIVEGTAHLPEVKDTAGEENLQDIEKARENIEQIINQGTDALDTLVDLAKQSQSARAFEVVSTMMRTLLDANKEFVDMSTKRKYAKEDHGSAGSQGNTTNVTNNNLILSTTDLLKMLKGEND
jgi:hypothetical protein